MRGLKPLVKLGCCFCFNIQEELSFVFEMLGLYEEALIQYDEIDALLTQLVINSKYKGIGREQLYVFYFSPSSQRSVRSEVFTSSHG